MDINCCLRGQNCVCGPRSWLHGLEALWLSNWPIKGSKADSTHKAGCVPMSHLPSRRALSNTSHSETESLPHLPPGHCAGKWLQTLCALLCSAWFTSLTCRLTTRTVQNGVLANPNPQPLLNNNYKAKPKVWVLTPLTSPDLITLKSMHVEPPTNMVNGHGFRALLNCLPL